MKNCCFAILSMNLIISSTYAQNDTLISSSGPFTTQFRHIKSQVIKADTTPSRLLTAYGFNIFLQRKALQYLTGVSDLALAKFYASYTTDNDKLNLGFNIPSADSYQRLSWIFNPILEADIKKSFSKIYEDKTWQNNIRVGMKVSHLLKKKSLNFWGNESTLSRKNELKALRAKTFRSMLSKENDALKSDTARIVTLNGDIIPAIPRDTTLSKKLKKARNSLYQEMGIKEADYLETERAYTKFQTSWVSFWAFVPITPASYFITPAASKPFEKRNYTFWEVNLQYTRMHDFARVGTFYASIWLKHFNNNSVNSEQITGVDYNRYFVNPPSNDTLNYTGVKTYKGYLGNFAEFKTTMINFQLVYLLPDKFFFRPGISVRYERNYGEYRASNLRFGLPIIIQGKEKPVTLELQYRLDNINNYQKIADSKTKKSLGISIGLPFASLHK